DRRPRQHVDPAHPGAQAARRSPRSLGRALRDHDARTRAARRAVGAVPAAAGTVADDGHAAVMNLGATLADPRFVVIAAVFGALFGSFLNVCLHRLPPGGSLGPPPPQRPP